ncbi:MAG: DUF411 domain-containing protein [Sulfuritalea sp.]|jgi:hypothetical protein|uniref:DUF411 domain-containing protein n=1 Tax=Denitratisoma sp. DHT3 TaxID=1981880 RepID=UPI001198B236|nr:DUF411 domain-containing protein [Denitratisoma sp. DHT3]MDK9714771.1 DUF411 domain-containing protein [Sulfuritalea sp.]QDX80967.1 metal-binding protein [Denitratisoma sp. DHT3]
MKSAIRTAVLLALFSPAVWAAGALPTVEVYKSPTCGCCGKWVDHMKANGFKVVTHEMNDVTPHKQRLGVPVGMGSCHTAEVGGYLVEGHVPAEDVKRLLAEKPQAKGLVSPGMPQSAPGMDLPGKVPYEVLLVRADGSTATYARH